MKSNTGFKSPEYLKNKENITQFKKKNFLQYSSINIFFSVAFNAFNFYYILMLKNRFSSVGRAPTWESQGPRFDTFPRQLSV